MKIKGKISELGVMVDDDGETTTKVSKAVVKKIRKAVRLAVDEIEIEIDEEVQVAVDKYMTDWLRQMVSEEAYFSITPCGGKIEAYISIPVGRGSEDDPSWTFDLAEAINELFELEDGGKIPLTPEEREATVKTRDAFQRMVELYNKDLEKR